MRLLLALLAIQLASSACQANQQDPLLQARMQANTYLFERQLDHDMQMHKLNASNSVACNDGSPIGYYRRLNSHSRTWLIYLQGGGFCGSSASCRQRWRQNPHLMSSKQWPQTKSVDGILSSKPADNPYLWNANHIFVPYCSSDSWTGIKPAGAGEPFAFMGARIIEQVLDSLYDDLPRESSLYEAQYVLLAGDSAGATGVILNLDNVDAIIKRRATDYNRSRCNSNPAACERPAPALRGLADSGWFLDNEPYAFDQAIAGESAREPTPDSNVDCDSQRCSPVQYISQAMRFWNGQVPIACADQHPDEPWRCYFGYRAYATLRAPLFVVQWLYDEAQLIVDNIARPDTTGQWSYVNKVVNEMRTSLENVSALFAPSCFSHGLIIKKAWNQINIDGYKLPHVLNSWEEQSLTQTSAPSDASPVDRETTPTVRTDSSSAMAYTSSQQGEPGEMSAPPLTIPLQLTVSGPSQASSDTTIEPEGSSQPKSSSQQNHIRRATHPARTRTRKKKRNNQQHRSRLSGQNRQKLVADNQDVSQSATSSSTRAPTNTAPFYPYLSKNIIPARDQGQVSGDQLSQQSDRAASTQGRLGRSTLIDDSSWLINNNVPEDQAQNLFIERGPRWQSGDQSQPPISLSAFGFTLLREHNGSPSQRFRLIDNCGWPQCNRDCPMKLETEFSLTTSS